MRINRYIADRLGIARRKADEHIASGRVQINGKPASAGHQVQPNDIILVDGRQLPASAARKHLVAFNKPPGYVCSQAKQGGAPTIYVLLPAQYRTLNPIGRLDKDSSGLLLLTNDGQLAYRLSHPKFVKNKVYEIALDKPLTEADRAAATGGVPLTDGLSRLQFAALDKSGVVWQITMHEGRNRQIRRTFEALGYKVIRLHRTVFGEYSLQNLLLDSGEYAEIG